MGKTATFTVVHQTGNKTLHRKSDSQITEEVNCLDFCIQVF